ncbi:MAG: DUF4181 domain-containing protein [Bacillus sp. (in: Bacteria)]|nr:DUF4181 domain-containing protein [Bacillus sp. (in: firmicutes)]
MKRGGRVGFFLLISIGLVWFFAIDRIIRRKFNTPKRNWSWYKHDSKGFAALFYLFLLAFILIPFVYPEANLLLTLPFAGTAINLLYSLEKYIYRTETKLYVNYLSNAVFWLILGGVAFTYFH